MKKVNDKSKKRPGGLRKILSVRNRVAHVALWFAGVTPLLAMRPSNAIPYSALEMLRLFVDVRIRRPATVMEFGVGSSTIAIAAALEKNAHGRLITVDGSEQWIAICQESLPERLRKYVEFVYSPVEVVDGGRAHRYTRVPAVALDYLFVDGPSPEHVPDWQGPPVAADPVLGMTFNPGARLTVEGRLRNVEYLRERLGPSWKMKKDRIFAWSWTLFDKQT